MMFALGVLAGLLFAVVAVITGKKFEIIINDPKVDVMHTIREVISPRKAQIIKSEDAIEEFLHEK